MKTIISSILLLICSILNAQNNETNLKIDIRGKDCNGGLSFCTVEIDTMGKQISQKFMLNKFSETELQFTIKTKELTIEEQKVIFGKEIVDIYPEESYNFNQIYDFQLTSDCIKLLELNPKYCIIKNGSYPISLINDKAIIIFKLTNKI